MIQELKDEYSAIKAWSKADKIRLGLFIAPLVISVWIVFPIQYALSSEEGKWLKVFLTLNTNLVSQLVYFDISAK
jgi:hypothetical protein